MAGLTGCGQGSADSESGGGGKKQGGTLTILAASSLTDAFGELGKTFAKQNAGVEVKQHGRPNDLTDRLRRDPSFAKVNWGAVMDATRYVGRAPQQVEQFVQATVEPIRRRYRQVLGQKAELKV